MDINSILKDHNQEHVLQFWDELTENQQKSLLCDLEAINWSRFKEWSRQSTSDSQDDSVGEIHLEPAPYYPAIPDKEELVSLYEDALEKGKQVIKNGEVAAFTVAGGQGTRLGFDAPKGMFPISPVKQKSLFQLFAESIARFEEIYDTTIRWYIMASTENEGTTKDYFETHDYFNLRSDQVVFFVQGQMPAFDLNGNLILKEKWQIAQAPDGHGGSLRALKMSGALTDMENHGVNYISYFQVDNPLVTIIDPLFIGLHCLTKSEMSSKSIPKTGPMEKMGVFCKIDGKIGIVEYSDLPDELAVETDSNGKLRFGSGSPAIHAINREFVETLNENKFQLPFHIASKKIPFVDETGSLTDPDKPNGIKLETFVFDALPLTSKTMILEAVREQEFAPTKNASGVDSVESARKMMIAEHQRWLSGKQITIDNPSDCVIEISPRRYVNDDDFFHSSLSEDEVVGLIENKTIYIT